MNAADLPAETLFEEALQCRTPQERAAYLDRVCAGQPDLRRRLEVLLKAHDQSGRIHEPAAAAARPTVRLDPAPVDEAVGQVIGRYKLLEQVGEGGCGVVYVAEQTQPVRRRVALKVIKLGMDTKQVVARFEAERQALAMTAHRNIAKVLDAGAVVAPDRNGDFPANEPGGQGAERLAWTAEIRRSRGGGALRPPRHGAARGQNASGSQIESPRNSPTPGATLRSHK